MVAMEKSPVVEVTLDELNKKIDAVARSVAELAEGQRRREEMFDEFMPIARSVMDVGVERFGHLEKRGYFAFVKELGEVADRVITNYKPEDLRQLADSVVTILDTVRHLTQPEMLELANRATDAVENVDELTPVGVMGVLRATREDEVQQGLAALLEVMRQVGKGAKALEQGRQGPRRNKLANLTAPRLRSKARSKPRVQRPAAKKRAAKPVTPANAVVAEIGAEVDAGGHLVDSTKWTREIAAQLAVASGIAELTDEHWRVLEFCRTEYAETGKSPNIRRIALGADMPVKALYRLFPRAPGRTAARCAGVPKPVGCI